MKKYITLTCVALSSVIIIDSLHIVDGFFAFLITGTLPFGLAVSPLGMMIFVGLAFIALTTYGYTILLDKLASRHTKFRLPERRFRNI